jgi:cell wall-associated NlpC family hydrolase
MGWKHGRVFASATAAGLAGLLFVQFGATANAVPSPAPTPNASMTATQSASAKPTTVADAAAQVKKLEDEAAEIGEQYNDAQDALDAGTARLKVLQDDIALQQKKVDQLSAQAQAIALAQFRSRDIDTTVQIFTSGDPETMMAKLSTVNKVDENMDQILADQQAEQANLTDMQRSAQAEVAALADQEQQMAELKKQADDKVADAKALYNTLSAQEQARLNASDGESATSDPGDYADASARIQTAIKYALGKVPHSQYVWGASGPSGFDCSGLMLASYRAAGISLPHSSQAQSHLGRAVSKSDLKPGDLIFFYHPVHHVGMYIGGGKFVHARNTRADLVVQSLASYPAPWAGARRVLN